jgi:phage terminase small subunit
MARELTGKQRMFAEIYLQCFNKTEAARRAGYQGNNATLRNIGCENFTKPNIRAYIEERMASACLSTDEALVLLANQATFDPGPYLILDKDSPEIDLKKLRDAGLTGAIKSITPTASGVKVEFESRQGAIDKILRAAGAYQDKVDVTSDGKALTFKVVYENGANGQAEETA